VGREAESEGGVKEISLTQGKVALVDDCDFEHLSRFRWYAFRTPYMWYARRNESALIAPRTTIWMHRAILGAQAKQIVDHLDDNGLNNTRANIRLCTKSQNGTRQRKYTIANSRFKGVTPHGNGWVAQIWRGEGVKGYIGFFHTEQEAAMAYDIEAVKRSGEFTRPNFPHGWSS
jgi:hypothetical protein